MQHRLRKFLPLLIGGGVYVFFGILVWVIKSQGFMLIYNRSVSLPRGLYWMTPPPIEIKKNTIIIFPVPEQVKPLVESRRWLPAGVPLMKPVAAVEGDEVCIRDDGVTINRQMIAPVLLYDSKNRPLPIIRGCVTLGKGELFPLSTYIPNSFDGRYYGTIFSSEVRGVATLLANYIR